MVAIVADEPLVSLAEDEEVEEAPEAEDEVMEEVFIEVLDIVVLTSNLLKLQKTL